MDLPETIDAKRMKLEKMFGNVPENVTLIPVDFDHQDLDAALRSHGYGLDEKTFFIWEGVTMYLTEAGVRQTLTDLAQAPPGSRLVFTYVQKDFLDGTARFGLSARSQLVKVKDQLWRFGLKPDQVAAFLAEYGWREVEQMGSQDAARWYPTPSRRTLRATDIERTVYAELTDERGDRLQHGN